MSDTPVLRVAIAVPLRAFFDYLPPADCDLQSLVPGMRLRVPFGRGERIALLLEVVEKSAVAPALLKPVREILDQKPLIDFGQMDFLLWAASYYQHPAGDVLMSALPVRFRKGGSWVKQSRPGWALTGQGADFDLELLKRAPRQREILSLLLDRQIPFAQTQLKEMFDDCKSVLKSLEQKNLIKKVELQKRPEPAIEQVAPPQLNSQQQSAVDAVSGRKGFDVSLLYGITGSGKTEVYLALANQCVEQGRQVLVLVPEIGLTPQLVSRFSSRIKTPLAVLHSAMSETERALAWQQAKTGEAQLVIGTRSAVFTPLPKLGLVIVDEEHDMSFKQQEGFRYSARDMAVALAKRVDCPVVLGSATPSLESLQNVKRKSYRRLDLLERAGTAKPPKMDLVDVRSVRLEAGLSPVSKRLIGEELTKGHQVLVFLNRRGFAPVLTCHDCGWVDMCHRCDARMTLHAKQNLLWCHHCGAQHRLPQVCPDCGSSNLITLGQGTEQLESSLKTLFPDASCVRIDFDSTRKKGSLENLLDEVHAGKHQLLVGTQMLAKGHDFPNVTLVVILDVDQGLYGSDFRASERMAQQIVQVAGRAGRSEKPGRVLIQTHHPDHIMLQTLVRDGYSAFAEQALAERKEIAFPPFQFQVLMRAEASSRDLPGQFLSQAVELSGSLQTRGIEFLGPLPAAMQKRAGRFREHLLLQSASRLGLHELLQDWLPLLESSPLAKKVRWSVDVDPQEFYS